MHHGTSFESGALSLAALARMRVQDSIAAFLRQRLNRIGPGYTALHIRDTDYKTDYRQWLERSCAAITGPVFVATDNREVVAHCRAALGTERVHSFATLPEEAGQPLHVIENVADAYVRNSDAILDLLMLALAKDLYLFEVQPNRLGAKYSGYSVLASNLKGSPPILQQLLGQPGG